MPGKITGLCGVCDTTNAKYRCPKCVLVYCSLGCYKNHKENSCTTTPPVEATKENVPQPPPPPLQFTEEEMNEDVIQTELLEKLGMSDHLKNMLANRHLKDMLHEINNSKKPERELEAAMQIPIFSEFVQHCLTVVEPPESPPDLLKMT